MDPVFAFVEEHESEFAMVGIGLAAVVLAIIAFKMGLIVGGLAALGQAISFILQNASRLVFG